MKINTAKLQENGVLINGIMSLPDGNSGHVQAAYQEWLEQGNEPEPQFTKAEYTAALVCEERAWRNSELARADIEVNKIEDDGGDATRLRAYRVTLRAYPQADDFPDVEQPIGPRV